MPTPTTIRIVVADDSPIFREGLIKMIHQTKSGSVSVVGCATNGEELISQVERKHPDIALTDIRMPGINGIEASSIIYKRFKSTDVIALTMYSETDVIYQMFETGAKGYVTKNAEINEVIEAIEAVHNGEMYYCNVSSMNLLKKIGPTKYDHYKKNSSICFTEKEIKLMKLICIQLTAKEIADKMKISQRTVEEYSHHIKEKIDAKNLVGIALYALKNNIVSLNEI